MTTCYRQPPASMLSATILDSEAMRRAERLFQIIQILRRSRAPVTADAIAAELETSKRSVYRDIAALVGQRAPIRGEAGVGYVLDAGFDMPPLMLTPDEIEAAVRRARGMAKAKAVMGGQRGSRLACSLGKPVSPDAPPRYVEGRRRRKGALWSHGGMENAIQPLVAPQQQVSTSTGACGRPGSRPGAGAARGRARP